MWSFTWRFTAFYNTVKLRQYFVTFLPVAFVIGNHTFLYIHVLFKLGRLCLLPYKTKTVIYLMKDVLYLGLRVEVSDRERFPALLYYRPVIAVIVIFLFNFLFIEIKSGKFIVAQFVIPIVIMYVDERVLQDDCVMAGTRVTEVGIYF